MTADERIEALLNRAGQTISDLPKRYRQEHRNTAFDAADKFGGSLSMTQNFEDYILHLTDVIDRMETALENVLVERDWFVEMSGRIGFCFACGHWNESADECDVGYKCDPNSREGLLYSYSGVPEDWRVDE